MEYQFTSDASSGQFRAHFNSEHQVFGQWLETEVKADTEKLANVLKLLDQHKHSPQKELKLIGKQYTLILSEHDAIIAVSASLQGTEMAENLLEQDLNFDSSENAMCGIEDFQALILAWANFLTK